MVDCWGQTGLTRLGLPRWISRLGWAGLLVTGAALAQPNPLPAAAAAAAAAAAVPPVAATVAPQVQVPSLDRVDGQPLLLTAHWVAAAATGPRPVIVLLHGCAGAYGRTGKVSQHLGEYTALLTAEGWHVLVLDSFSARGAKQICTQAIGTRAITQQQRRRDALGALQWLATQPGVDASRLVLLGWSNGGSTVLAATNRHQSEVAASTPAPRAAVAFYPGCETERQRGYQPSAPLLMQVGAADDWTPAAPCEALARESGAPAPRITVYPGAHHGFDSAAPLRHWAEVPNGAKPGAGVHLGGQPEARAASREALLSYLRAALQ